MKKKAPLLIVLILLEFIVLSGVVWGKGSPASESEDKASHKGTLKNYAPNIFVDCHTNCYISHLKEEVTYLNYVRDRKEADIHLLVTAERTGSGGRKYTLSFLGQEKFADNKNKIKFSVKSTDTEAQIRETFLKSFKMGLMPFLAQTPLSDYLNVTCTDVGKSKEVKDPWNNWVFKVSLHASVKGEEQKFDLWSNGNISISRVTEENKFNFTVSTNYSENRFEHESETIVSTSNSHYSDIYYVISLGEHWSAGSGLEGGSSSYNNKDLYIKGSPIVEFNVFPYSEATKREFTLQYALGAVYNNYQQKTIYNKLKEQLFYQEMTIAFETVKKWGSVTTSIEGSHYLHDLSKNNLSAEAKLSLELFKGFSFFVYGEASMIHDQLALPKGEISREEVLLQRQQLETQYSYSSSLGLSYTFGSIYSNVVNPRIF